MKFSKFTLNKILTPFFVRIRAIELFLLETGAVYATKNRNIVEHCKSVVNSKENCRVLRKIDRKNREYVENSKRETIMEGL